MTVRAAGRAVARGGEVRVVVLLTAAFALLGLAFTLLVPMFGNFDEQTHLDRARFTARHPFEDVGPALRRTAGSWGALLDVEAARSKVPADPVAYRGHYLPFHEYPGGDAQQQAPCPGVCQNIQYVHPPGWYLLAAPVTAAFESRPFPLTVLAVRTFDVLLVTPVVAFAWAAAREVWPTRPRRRLAATALVALMGPLAYSASAMNNDALLFLAAGAATFLAARILRRGPTIPSAALLGAVITIGLLTKVQMVLMAPAFGLAVLAGPADARRRAKGALAFALTAMTGAVWWIESALDSNPLAPKGSELISAPKPGPWSHQSYLSYAVEKLPKLVGRFWGTYSEPVTFTPAWVQAVLGTAVVVLAVGWVVTRSWRRPTVSQLRWLVLAAVPGFLTAGVMQASVSAYRRSGALLGLAPRYVYPAAPIFAIGVVAAAGTIAARVRRRPLWGWVLPVATLAAAAGAVLSVARAGQEAYGTSSVRAVLDAARSVGPVGRPAVALTAVGVLWLGVVALAARDMALLGRREPVPASPPAQEPAG